MALLTATELKASREAAEAGVSTVSDADATLAISEAEAILYSDEVLGYRVQVTETSFTIRGAGGSVLRLPQIARTVTAVTQDGVETSSDVYWLTGNGWALRSYGTWAGEAIVVTGTFGIATSDNRYILAKKAVRLLASRLLQETKTGSGLPSGTAGSYLTGYSSENASFTFFTPGGTGTGYTDIDRLVDLIGRNPFKKRNVLKTVQLGSTGDS